MISRQHRDIHIDPSTNLTITIESHDDRMSSRMDVNFMLNVGERCEPEPTEHPGQLLAIRHRPAMADTNRRPSINGHSLHSLDSMEFRYESWTEKPSSPGSSTTEWSEADYASRRPSVDKFLPTMQIQRPKSAEYSPPFTRLPPLQALRLPSPKIQNSNPPQYSNTVCMNENHPSHSCTNCWQHTMYGPIWSCCQCDHRPRNQVTSHALVSFQPPLQDLEGRNEAPLDKQRSHSHPSRGSRSPQRHEPYDTSHRPSSHSKAHKKNNTKTPHSNKKYTRWQVHWMRYRKEDCTNTFDSIVSQWEAQWPGERDDCTPGSISSRVYRDNLMPLFNYTGKLIRDPDDKIVMDTCKVRQRGTNPECPFTFIERLPYHALDPNIPFPISVEHKEQARKLIQQDLENPNSIGALCRTALREFEAAIAPTSSQSGRSARQEGMLAEAAGYVILVESKAIKEACRCHKGKKNEVFAHQEWCGAVGHPALRACQCPAEVRGKTSLHLPYCPTAKWPLNRDASSRR